MQYVFKYVEAECDKVARRLAARPDEIGALVEAALECDRLAHSAGRLRWPTGGIVGRYTTVRRIDSRADRLWRMVKISAGDGEAPPPLFVGVRGPLISSLLLGKSKR